MAVAMESILSLVVRTTGAEGIQRLQQGISGLGRGVKAAEASFKGFAGSVAGLSGVMGMLTPLLSVAGIAALGNKAIEAGDKFFDLSQKTGVSVEALAKFSKAAQLNGTDVDGVAKALQKLSKGMMDSATTGSGPAAGALKVLGISATNASGRLRGVDEVMLQVADRFKTMPDGATKTALALQLFGKAGADMIPMLNQGSEAISNLGTKMTAEFAAKADEYNDKLIMLGGAANGLGITLADALLPTLIDITDRTLGFVKSIVDYVDKNKAGIQTVLSWINAFGTATAALVKTTIDQVGALSRVLGRLSVGDFAGAVQEARQYLSDFASQAQKDFTTLGQIISGTGSDIKAAGQGAAGAVNAAKQETIQLQNEQEEAKQKQAQWKAWVDETEASYHRMNFTISQAQQAIAGSQRIMDARVTAEIAINNAAKTNLQIRLGQAQTDAQRLAISRQIADIDIANARLQMEMAKAQEVAGLKDLQLKIQSAKVGQAQAEATLAEAQARGIATAQYEKALAAQIEVVKQSLAEYDIAKQVAVFKGKAADATYEAAVAQARASVSAVQMKIQQDAIASSSAAAANNIRQMPSSLDAAARSANRLAGNLEQTASAVTQIGLASGRISLGGIVPNSTSSTTSRSTGLSLPRYAEGGFVQSPTVAMVGEGGQPEYVIPASKMAAASSSYLAGARGSAVLQGGGAAPAGDVQISITTGPVMQANGEQWVTVKDLERAMRTTADGVLSRVRTPAARRVLGIR